MSRGALALACAVAAHAATAVPRGDGVGDAIDAPSSADTICSGVPAEPAAMALPRRMPTDRATLARFA